MFTNKNLIILCTLFVVGLNSTCLDNCIVCSTDSNNNLQCSECSSSYQLSSGTCVQQVCSDGSQPVGGVCNQNASTSGNQTQNQTNNTNSSGSNNSGNTVLYAVLGSIISFLAIAFCVIVYNRTKRMRASRRAVRQQQQQQMRDFSGFQLPQQQQQRQQRPDSAVREVHDVVILDGPEFNGNNPNLNLALNRPEQEIHVDILNNSNNNSNNTMNRLSTASHPRAATSLPQFGERAKPFKTKYMSDADFDVQLAMAIEQNLLINRLGINPDMAADPDLQIAIMESRSMDNIQENGTARSPGMIGPRINRIGLPISPTSLERRSTIGNYHHTPLNRGGYRGSAMNGGGYLSSADAELDRIILEQVLEESKKQQSQSQRPSDLSNANLNPNGNTNTNRNGRELNRDNERNNDNNEMLATENNLEETKENLQYKIVTARKGGKMNLNNLGTKNDDETKCIICLDRRSNTFLAPCLHRDFCDRCAKRLMEFSEPRCPLCKMRLEEVRLIVKPPSDYFKK